MTSKEQYKTNFFQFFFFKSTMVALNKLGIYQSTYIFNSIYYIIHKLYYRYSTVPYSIVRYSQSLNRQMIFDITATDKTHVH